nr:somatostatin homolog [Anguilla japonica=Japanese eels, intestine, Peptide Partial, 23 aa] [Anguilla japonica]
SVDNQEGRERKAGKNFYWKGPTS